MLGVHWEENGPPEWADLAADLESLHSPPAASLGPTVPMRGAVLAPPRARDSRTTSSTGDTSVLPAATVQLAAQTGTFSLRGELMHAFVSYRVETEGGWGGMSSLLANKVRALSMGEEELKIPQHGW